MHQKTAIMWILLLGVFVLGVVVIIGVYGDWQKSISHYNQVARDNPPYQKNICNHIDEFLSTKDGVRIIKGMLDKWSGTRFLNKCAPGSGVDVLKMSDEQWISAVHTGNIYNYNKYQIEVTTECVAGCRNDGGAKPVGFVDYALNSINPKGLIAGYIVIAALLFYLYLVGGMFFRESHLGWRRLIIVTSLIAAITVPTIYFYDDRIEYPDVFFMFFAALIGAFGVMVFGRKIYLWVKEGFHDDGRGQQLSEATIHQGVLYSESIVADSVAGNIYYEATYWPRFWARCIDMSLIWVLGSMIASVAPDFRTLLPTTTGILIGLIVGLAFICATLLAYETLCISKFGSTIGKLIFGLRVRNEDGHLPTWKEAWRRSLGFLESGLYFMLFFPWLQIVGATLAWKRRQKSMVWDVLSKTHVEQHKINIIRYAISAIIAILLISMMGVAELVLKGDTKQSLNNLFSSSNMSQVYHRATVLAAVDLDQKIRKYI